MPRISDAVVNQALDVLIESNKSFTSKELAHKMGVHKTTAGMALRHLVKLDMVTRERGVSYGGQPPWVYSVPSDAEVIAPTKRDTNKSRPKTVRRTQRGAMPDLVRKSLSHWKPNGRGFTVAQMQKQVGQGSYETVRRAVDELVASGEILPTGKCRKAARLYVPVDQSITAPTPPPVPANLTGIEALLDERDQTRARLSRDEARLAEIELELDAIRSRLA